MKDTFIRTTFKPCDPHITAVCYWLVVVRVIVRCKDRLMIKGLCKWTADSWTVPQGHICHCKTNRYSFQFFYNNGYKVVCLFFYLHVGPIEHISRPVSVPGQYV